MMILAPVLAVLFSCAEKDRTDSFVTFYAGDVTIQRGEAVKPLQVKDQVKDGDVIRTGEKSCVVIQSTDGLVLRVEQKSEVAVSLFNVTAKKQITLNNGKVLSSVEKLKKGYDYSVKTPTAVASVRGTEFLTEFNGKDSIIAVAKGSVKVTKTTGPADEKIVDTGKTAVVVNEVQEVKIRNMNRAEILELSKFKKTPVVENIEKKKPEEIKELFMETQKVDEQINSEIKEETGLTPEEMKDKYGRIDIITLYNGRVVKGVITSRGNFYRIVTQTRVEIIDAKDVKNTETKMKI
jgi:mRNA-degrading endonuclease HigB of HigAB toxin-antitoxin module